MDETTGQDLITTADTALDRARVGGMTFEKFGGLTFGEYREAIEFGKFISRNCRHGIPAYLIDNAGDCVVITTQALRHKVEPIFAMQHSYVAAKERSDGSRPEGTLIAYDAAYHAAVINASGKLKGKPRYSWSGEGEQRKCTVSILLAGEKDPLDYETPPLVKCRGRSPLWARDPDQQLGYYAIRSWGRRHLPEVLAGVYDIDEFDRSTQAGDPEPEPSPQLMERLSGRMEGPGFSATVVDEGLNGRSAEEEETKPKKRPRKAKDAPPAAEMVREPDPPASDPEPPVEQEEASEQVADEPVPEVDPLGDFVDLDAFDGERWLVSVNHSLRTATDEAGMIAVREGQFRPHRLEAISLADGTWDAAVSAYGKRWKELGLPAPATTKAAKPAAAAPQKAASEAGLFQAPKAAAPAQAAQRGSKAQDGTKDHPGFHPDGMMRCPAWAQQYPTWVKWWSGRITVADWQVKIEEQWLDEADLRRELQMSPRETKAARALVDDEIARRKDAARKK